MSHGGLVPPSHDLIALLQGFILDVLSEQPVDFVEHAANYFHRLQEKRRDVSCSSTLAEESDVYTGSSALSTLNCKLRTSQRLLNRRNSVASEPYEPVLNSRQGEEKCPVYPKSIEAHKRLEKVVQKIFIFNSCSKEQIDKILGAMYERVVFENETIIRQGDPGDNFYVIDKGDFDVLFDCDGVKEIIGTLRGPGSFGELALMYNCPRSATIRATMDGVLWVLDRFSFKRILVDTTERRRHHYENLLENVPILSSLTAYERTTLADALTTTLSQDEECIIRQGDAADCMFFIEEGTVEISVRDSKDRSQTKIISQAGKGDYFGELALVNKTNRVASVHAKGDVTCAVLDVNAFERLLGPCKELMKRNMKKYEHQRRMLGIKEMPTQPRN